MRKLLTLIAIIASFLLVSCAGDPIASRLPWVYKIEIQQGNVIKQDDVNQLRLGMSRRQAQFILGNPLIADPFHANRWDYYYQYIPGTKGEGEARKERIALFFEEDRLVKLDGSILPDPNAPATAPNQIATINVPRQEIDDPGILTRFWRWMTFRGAAPEQDVFRPDAGPVDNHVH